MHPHFTLQCLLWPFETSVLAGTKRSFTLEIVSLYRYDPADRPQRGSFLEKSSRLIDVEQERPIGEVLMAGTGT